MIEFDAIEREIDALAASAARDAATLTDATASARARQLVALGERVLETWVEARGETPTQSRREGFRLLALHAQGARGEPSFHAVRETCRELVYHGNLIDAEPGHGETRERLLMMTFLARQILLFVEGKLEVAGLGTFCCSARPLRASKA